MTSATSGRVVVGVDGSPGSAAALEYAVGEARRRATTLVVVSAVHWDNPGIEFTRPSDDQLQTWGHHLVAEMIEKVPDGNPPLVVAVVSGHPATTLLQQARDAAVLVVGSRGHGTMRSVLVGSVSLRCVTHAVCPTVVVPTTHSSP